MDLFSTIFFKIDQNVAPSFRLSASAKMVATEGGFYQILADIPKKSKNAENLPRPQPR